MDENQDMRTKAGDMAVENFKNGLNCAESVMDALIRSGALESEHKTLISACTGFGGGIGLSGQTCGALTAAVMANSAVHGRPDPWKVDEKVRAGEIADKYYRRYNHMVHDFSDKYGSAQCSHICKPFGDFHCKERRVNCLKLIGNTAKLACDYLAKDQDEAFALPYYENLGGNQ